MERGQSTVEWVALILLVSLAFAVLGAIVGIGLPGTALADAVASRLICAVGLSGSCERDHDELAFAYGAEIAALVRDHAPDIFYEDGMRELPIDYRACRGDPCSVAAGSGAVWRTDSGLPAVSFTHVVDCRPEAPGQLDAGTDCTGDRAGNLYLQYWLYYPDSATEPWGDSGFHRDDWESFQVRIGDETAARASSHHSYNHDGGIDNWPTDAGVWKKSGWGPYTGELHVSAGSHAGHVEDDSRPRRYTPRNRIRMIPIEPLAGSGAEFEVTPPWLKEVYLDPESEST